MARLSLLLAEQALVSANRELAVCFEKKIQATHTEAWGEDKSSPAEHGKEEGVAD